MNKNNYHQATMLINRIQLLEVFIKELSKLPVNDLFDQLIAIYQKELDKLEYKLYHL